ncbi:hypothetical protein GQ53DRAFT_629251, partial [Thozetella sp. PMI_491]
QPKATTTPWVPPSLALACLQSIPVDVANDVALIDYILPFITFQSTLGYLKDPPKGYLIPGVDVVGGFQEIRQKLRNGGYTNQFEFTQDITSIITAAADGHFNYSPGLSSVFTFYRSLNLASVSEDGLALPKIFVYNDIVGNTATDYTPSDVVSIDGVDITTFIIEYGATSTYQDPDAAWNNVFQTIPNTAAGAGGIIRYSLNPLPDSHNVTFANGTSKMFANRANIRLSFKGINTGEDVHSAAELPAAMATAEGKRATAASSTGSSDEPVAAGVTGYPSPVEIHKDKWISGYFLNDTAHADTCVLVLYSFETPGTDTGNPDPAAYQAQMLETRRVIESFFSDCKDANRTKLIIDVSANGGGLIFQGFELYRQLFPKAETWSGHRLRAHPDLDVSGKVVYGGKEESRLFGAVESPDGSRYPTWADLYGPVQESADSETNVLVYNFSDPRAAFTNATYPFIVNGFDPAVPAKDQPFDKDDIVVLTDGTCGSTCTILTGLMAREAGVRTIALGGRPLNAPMQSMGGVKGVQVLPFAGLQEVATLLAAANAIPADVSATFPSAGNPPLRSFALLPPTFNWRNGYPQNAVDGPPLQFVYEAANCKRFYKAEYLTDITRQWADIADVAWGGAECVQGSTASQDAKIGTAAPDYSDAVVSKQQAYSGPGSLT